MIKSIIKRLVIFSDGHTRGDSMDEIPGEVAFQLCAEIRQEKRGRWYTFAGLQCWGCSRFSKGDPEKMCVSNRPGYRGCNLVNARYERQSRAAL